MIYGILPAHIIHPQKVAHYFFRNYKKKRLSALAVQKVACINSHKEAFTPVVVNKYNSSSILFVFFNFLISKIMEQSTKRCFRFAKPMLQIYKNKIETSVCKSIEYEIPHFIEGLTGNACFTTSHTPSSCYLFLRVQYTSSR